MIGFETQYNTLESLVIREGVKMSFYHFGLEPVSVYWTELVPSKDDGFYIKFDVIPTQHIPLKFKTAGEIFSPYEDSIEAEVIIRSRKGSELEESSVTCLTSGFRSDDEGVWVQDLSFLLYTDKRDYSELINNIRAGLYPSSFSVYVESELISLG